MGDKMEDKQKQKQEQEKERRAEQRLERQSQELMSLHQGVQAVMRDSMRALSQMVEYQDLMLLYDSAIKVVNTKLDIINAAYQTRYHRNPIHSISSRRKKMTSIVQKLYRMGEAVTAENIERCLHDVAGVRVICSYLDDVYEVAQAIAKQDDICLVRQKDYISSPKRNGYRSLHLIIRVPVSFAEQTRQMEVEIQIRTIAMDFWASLEHQLKYKKELGPEEEQQIIERLRICAETIAQTDVQMLAIRRDIDKEKGDVTEMEEIAERLSHIDISFS